MPSPKKKKPVEQEPKVKKSYKLKPLEMIGLGLFSFAILVYSFNKCGKQSNLRADASTQNELSQEENDSLRRIQNLDKVRELYVVMDSVKLRDKPSLNGKILKILLYDEVVYDMKEQTKNIENIEFSAGESRAEPWVKVKTADEKVGWVFGAVVSFYKKPRPVSIPSDSTANDSSTVNTNTVAVPSQPVAPPPAQTTNNPTTRPTETPSRPGNTNR